MGKVNLRLGSRTAQLRDDLINKSIAAAPDPECPTPALDRVLDRMCGGDRALRDFFQLALGYSLFGHNAEERAFFWHGEGASGKSTLLSAVLAALGDYGARLNRETLEGDKAQHMTFLASLIGCRVAVVSEMEGEDLKTSRFKALVGGDEMMVNRMRQDPVPFRCVATIHAMANPGCLPSLRQVDESIRRRILIVPAGVSVPEGERDPAIKKDMLGDELPGVVHWLVEGAMRYAKDGFTIPTAVREATDRYFAAASPVGRWVGERCEVGPYRAAASDLYLDFAQWFHAMGFHRSAPTMQAWGRTLTGLGYDKAKSHGTVMRDGLRLGYQARGPGRHENACSRCHLAPHDSIRIRWRRQKRRCDRGQALVGPRSYPQSMVYQRRTPPCDLHRAAHQGDHRCTATPSAGRQRGCSMMARA